MRAARLFAVLAIVAACGDPSSPDDGLLAAPPDGEGMQLRMNLTLQPGQEGTWCKMFIIPEGGIDVGTFEHIYTDVSHHILLYPTFYRAEDVTEELIPNCDVDEDIRQYIIGIVYGSQSASEVATYPTGAAMKTFGGQVLMLEYHALNASDQPIDAEVRVNLWKTHDQVVSEAGTQFFYHPTIALAPGERATTKMRCRVPEGTRLLFGLGHMHKRGVKFRSWLKGEGLTEPLPLVSAESWDDADTRLYEPEIEVGANQYIEYECEFHNTENRTIIEGLSAQDNEMCVYLGSYYVPNGARLDYDTEWCDGVGSGPIRTGASNCGATVDCLAAIDYESDAEVPWEMCWAAACDGMDPSFDAFNDCRRSNCEAQCSWGDLSKTECQSCLSSACAAQDTACRAQTCGS